MSLPSHVYESIHRAWAGNTLEGLKNFIRIPAKSRAYNPEWETNGILKYTLEASSDWARQLLPNAEFEIIEKPSIPPALFIRIPATGNHSGKPAFFYGHLDKQPETEGWHDGLGPWTPVVRDGRLYGRGGVDDGYNYYLTLTAIKALEESGIAHPEVFCLFETDEESGSRDLAQYIQELAPRIGNPAFIAIADLGCNDMKRVWLTQSLRGTVSLTVDVRVLNTPSHSGLASGVVPSSFRIMRALLARIEDAQTGELLLPELNCEVPEDIVECLRSLSQENDVRECFDWAGNTHAQSENAFDALLANTWKPSLSIVGADGLPSCNNAGNVLRSNTSLRLSFRTPPLVDAQAALKAVIKTLTENVPCDAQVTISRAEAASGFVSPLPSGWLRDTLENAGASIFGNGTGYLFCGASIGTLPAFKMAFPMSPFINTGALGPTCNAHAPNEWLDLVYAEKLTCVFAELIAGIPSGD